MTTAENRFRVKVRANELGLRLGLKLGLIGLGLNLGFRVRARRFTVDWSTRM